MRFTWFFLKKISLKKMSTRHREIFMDRSSVLYTLSIATKNIFICRWKFHSQFTSRLLLLPQCARNFISYLSIKHFLFFFFFFFENDFFSLTRWLLKGAQNISRTTRDEAHSLINFTSSNSFPLAMTWKENVWTMSHHSMAKAR